MIKQFICVPTILSVFFSFATFNFASGLFVKSPALSKAALSIANDEKIVANANYFDLSAGDFSQDWLNEGLITANDDWSNVPSIVGFLGQDLTSSSGVDPQTVTGVSTFSNDIDVMANQTNPNTLTAGGVAEFDGLTNKVVALQGSGTADAPYILIHLNSLNRQNLNVSYVLRDVDGSSDNAMQPVALQYRVGETGNFTNVPEAFVSDATEGPSLSGKETNVSVQLPAAVNNSAKVQLRIITTNAPSSDEWVGIDNIQVTSSPFATTNPGTLQFSSTSYSASENAGTALVTVTRSGGTDGAVSVNFSAQNGTATGGSTCSTNVDFLTTSGNLNWANGEGGSKTFNVTLCDDNVFENDETVGLSLSNPTGGATISAGSANLVIQNDDAQPPTIQFLSSTHTASESNEVLIAVSRTGDLSGQSSVDFNTAASTATGAQYECTAGSDYINVSGSLTFDPGQNLKLIAVPVCPDQDKEPNETFNVTLSNPGGGSTTLGSQTATTVQILDTAAQFRNYENIVISQTGGSNGSVINVGGLTGTINSMRVTLYGVKNSVNASNLDVLLVGPQGQKFILMADAGGNGAMTDEVTLTFSDVAGQVLPQSSVFTSGTYEPTTWSPNQADFPSPAPAGPYLEPGSSVGGTPSLASAFGGNSPNGTWTLFIRDDSGNPFTGGQPTASIAKGWGLEFDLNTVPSGASIGGKVVIPGGRGILGALVTVSGGDLPQPKSVYTQNFGFYIVSGLTPGQTYTVKVTKGNYTFTPSQVNVNLQGNLQFVSFVGIRQQLP